MLKLACDGQEVGGVEFTQFDGGWWGVRGIVFQGHMAGIAVEEGKVMDGPPATVEVDGIGFGEVQFLQGDAEAAAVGFDEAFLGGPEMKESVNWRRGGLDGGPFRWGKLLFEPIEGEGFDDLDIDAYSSARSEDTGNPVAGVGNVECRAVRKKGFFPVRILEAAQVRGMAGFFECNA